MNRREDRETVKTERVQVMMTPGELANLDRWRYQQMIPSRAEAIRRLILSGLEGTSAAVERESKGGKGEA